MAVDWAEAAKGKAPMTHKTRSDFFIMLSQLIDKLLLTKDLGSGFGEMHSDPTFRGRFVHLLFDRFICDQVLGNMKQSAFEERQNLNHLGF